MERTQGELEAKPTNVNIREMSQGLASMPEEQRPEAKQVALNVCVDPGCPEIVYVDETYLTRVLMNVRWSAKVSQAKPFCSFYPTPSSSL
jgi:hypothetical protein